jgi:hypothetical protein
MRFCDIGSSVFIIVVSSWATWIPHDLTWSIKYDLANYFYYRSRKDKLEVGRWSFCITTPWPESASELYRPRDRLLSAKLVPTFADMGCHVVSVTDLYCRILGFLDRSCYFFFQVAPQLYSRGWVDPAPDQLFLRKCGSAGNQTRTSGSVARNSDH